MVNYKVGDLVKKKDNPHDDGIYIYLGSVQPGQQHPVVEEAMKILGNVETGWFTPAPPIPRYIVDHPSRYNKDSKVSGYMVEVTIWNIDIFEKV